MPKDSFSLMIHGGAGALDNVKDDKVAVRYHSCGTNSGSFGGRPASGRKVSVDELSIFRIANGRVAEQWCLVDDLMFGKQLGGKASAG